MRVAVVGTGISGLVAANRLHARHDLTIFEADDRIGGHSNTVQAPAGSISVPIDTGFIVCNTKTYPNFLELMDSLGVELAPSNMSFSVQCQRTGLEYGSGSWAGLAAQPLNLVRPSYWGLFRGILRFNREALALTKVSGEGPTLREFLSRGRYGSSFAEQYLIPMGAAIWSTPLEKMWDFPAKYFVRFFDNHGLLQVSNHPRWLTVAGGSQRYVKKLAAPFRNRIRLHSPVLSIRRADDHVTVHTQSAGDERFDQVILATHSDQSLRMLADASPQETEVLGAIEYQENEAVLHTDDRLMPRARRAWASWNYFVPRDGGGRATVTYFMNLLQNLTGPTRYFVTLNRTADIEPTKILYRTVYYHPQYTRASVTAQQRWAEISGRRRTHFCGAYWRHGFHEDGVVSGLAVAKAFEALP